MIEDALKSTRVLHRLILGVSLVTLVFSLSMRLTHEQRDYKTAIDALLDTDFSAYLTWLQPKLDAQIKRLVLPAIAPLREQLDKGGHLMFNLDEISNTLETPFHVGRISVEELVLSDLSSATLTQLNALNGLSLQEDVQLLVPQIEPLLAAIELFLLENPEAGKRVDNARATIGFDNLDFNAETFLPGESVSAALYFELVDAVSVGAAPVFQANFDANIMTIPQTSFLSWVEQSAMTSVVVQNNANLVFAPRLANAPRGYHQEQLGLLSLRLADEIKAAGPEQQSAPIFGTTVPGQLLVFAAPLILMSLVYYLFYHTAHLARLAPQHAREMATFAWLPISMTPIRLCL